MDSRMLACEGPQSYSPSTPARDEQMRSSHARCMRRRLLNRNHRHNAELVGTGSCAPLHTTTSLQTIMHSAHTENTTCTHTTHAYPIPCMHRRHCPKRHRVVPSHHDAMHRMEEYESKRPVLWFYWDSPKGRIDIRFHKLQWLLHNVQKGQSYFKPRKQDPPSKQTARMTATTGNHPTCHNATFRKLPCTD